MVDAPHLMAHLCNEHPRTAPGVSVANALGAATPGLLSEMINHTGCESTRWREPARLAARSKEFPSHRAVGAKLKMGTEREISMLPITMRRDA
jgi:hypothetical protein